MLSQHPGFNRDVKVKNRISFGDVQNRDPLKKEIGVADLPEVALGIENVAGNMHNTSSTSMMMRRYTWMISTGDYRYTEFLSKIEWYIFCAMLNWQTKLTALRWKDKPFVKTGRLIAGSTGLSNPALNRNIRGWSASWQVEIEMHFASADLEAEALQKETFPEDVVLP